jgi:acetylornithine deacetylase/succinyl-diaminopimelate desuccinylase-like protein
MATNGFLIRLTHIVLLTAALLAAQPKPDQRSLIVELNDLLSIPNVGTDHANIPRNAAFLRKMLERRGMSAELLETAGNPLIYGEKRVPAATRTVLFYIHYDGQPIDAARWQQPSPFTPVLRDARLEDGGKIVPDFTKLSKFNDNWRLYARSASDDKAPIAAFCAALDTLGPKLTANIRVIIDGEEEMGSRSLPAAIVKYQDKLRADLLVILDGPAHASGRPTVYFGARGGTSFDLTLYGSKFALHSGHYGNWIPNPAMRLAQLLASMKDDQGRTVIEGFYSDVPPLTDAQRTMLKSVPDDEPALLKLFGVARPDSVGESLQEALQYPSLNIHSMRSGDVGGVIPTEATAQIEMRLVKETTADSLTEKVLAHIRKQGYHIVDTEPGDAARMQYPKIAMVKRRAGGGGTAWRTEPESAEGMRVIASLQKAWDREPVCIRTMGGSVPAAPFILTLGVPVVGLPIVNFDNNQHSDNENLRLGNLWSGAVSIAALMR